ncbi:type II toxin-antitoxin system HicB family antitoxin [Paraburkholderia bonniea]|uniref:type II toxin-antitoxin system HicB family antitoxin n=1 Tax=Paraburkholderia bonniea TaxID=2152891 RepID=UPI001290C7BC|nr:type II toxin-antitoxin system HicB family antitoxin [Paraburkholderia bonniea]WJF90387.1 type II toxin-antitoxin system HicB family antitoxin [Paraburkholderia bonniea]WJF93702.1 type II toxin-antitoxin system HicB family antitoxin [Paraburkholderia bonniea]
MFFSFPLGLGAWQIRRIKADSASEAHGRGGDCDFAAVVAYATTLSPRGKRPNSRLGNKGYLARVEFDPRDNIFVDQVLAVADRISFHGETVTELTTDFHQAVDHSLEDGAKTGRAAQKPASGKLMLRIRPDVHAAIGIATTAATAAEKSINP